jgi:hypothetical protein
MCLTLCVAAGACDLEEVAITGLEPSVVVEAFARIRPAGGGTIFALLHGSVGVPDQNPDGPEAVVRVLAEGGVEVLLSESPDEECTYGDEVPDPADPRRCYTATLDPSFVQPSERLVLQVDVVGGGRIEGGTQVPAAYGLVQPSDEACTVITGPVEFVWTSSDGTWVYFADILLTGIASDLESLGVESPSDSAAFDAARVSQNDTTVTFPDGFFITDDLDYPAELTTVVEAGMQPGWVAQTYITATDRNFANWIRDQVFHPSGTVRIPSLVGEGTGVFGSSVVLEQRIAGDPSGCP